MGRGKWQMGQQVTPTVVLLGTLDTKGIEYGYIRERLHENGVNVILMDAGVLGEPAVQPDITKEEVAKAAGYDLHELLEAKDRGAAIKAMAAGAASIVGQLYTEKRLQGILGLGGSGGTALITQAMRALPIGVPKLMVSTMASGDTRPYVGEVDITMMYSVVDIAGINQFSAQILSNAAGAIAGMAKAPAPDLTGGKALVAATMFGVTTPAVEEARNHLEERGYEILVFHATGTGLSAKSAEAGGADLIIIYNSGRYRMAGRGSLAGLLPYGDANQIVVEMAGEVLPVVQKTPVLAGVCGTDPFRLMPVFLKQLKEMGFTGVQNFLTVGLFDGNFRANLEETGMGYDLEVNMIRHAHELGLLTAPYVFDEEQARGMAEAGADILVPHVGLTTSGTIGAETALTLDEAVERVQMMHDAAKEINPDIIVLCHGGPIAEPDDAAYVLERTTGVVGFFGASSMERLPTEVAISTNMRKFKSIGHGGE